MLVSLLLVSSLGAQPDSTWHDPSPHRVSFVSVAPNVRLEVLDWGGIGPALVFLAGYGNSAHAFDGFAPQFAARFHVLGITRRGFGASGRPVSGYESSRLTRDILAVLDSLGIRRASFAGHSFAGSELNFLGAHYPSRVNRLTYLDASYDFVRLYADPRWKQAYPTPKPPAPSGRDNTFAAWVKWYSVVLAPGYPESEVRSSAGAQLPDSIETLLERGTAPAEFNRIQAPVLAFWAAPASAREQYPYMSLVDAAAQARLNQSFQLSEQVRRDQINRFRREVPLVRVVPVKGGRHYVFLTHPRLVADEMLRFLIGAGPPAPIR